MAQRKAYPSMSQTENGKTPSGVATGTAITGGGNQTMSDDSRQAHTGEDSSLLVEVEAGVQSNRESATDQVERRLQELRERIRAADTAYYVNDSPLISDADYDG